MTTSGQDEAALVYQRPWAASTEHSFDFEIENGNILAARGANRRQPL